MKREDESFRGLPKGSPMCSHLALGGRRSEGGGGRLGAELTPALVTLTGGKLELSPFPNKLGLGLG